MTQLDTTRLEAAREQTRRLIAGIDEDDLERVHSPLMSPLVWDLGHIAAFEDLWLAHRHGGLPLLRPDLMEVYDAFETPRADRGSLPYLRRAEAEEYQAEVRRRVRDLPVGDGYLHELVARHERQHNETMLQTLNLARIGRPGGDEPAAPARLSSGLEMVDVAGGAFPLGTGDEGFSYDNERPRHAAGLKAFRIGRVPVTNGDWLNFVRDGGYTRREWWSVAGWAWREAGRIERPLNWLTEELEWRLTDGAAELDPQRPVVHISWFEADAFARSRGLRLPTETEWEAAATWDGAAKRTEPPGPANLLEAGILGTAPVGAFPENVAPCGVLGMTGDVWEWTSSQFRGYPGFTAHPYREYSEVFFGSEHRVLRGGSFATSATVASATFRNWDHPQRRQIFAGVRVARDA
ncbi:MAG: ergothioneine biosynthesis protein EgtB [Solirubrobacteraceae bacterium]